MPIRVHRRRIRVDLPQQEGVGISIVGTPHDDWLRSIGNRVRRQVRLKEPADLVTLAWPRSATDHNCEFGHAPTIETRPCVSNPSEDGSLSSPLRMPKWLRYIVLQEGLPVVTQRGSDHVVVADRHARCRKPCSNTCA